MVCRKDLRVDSHRWRDAVFSLRGGEVKIGGRFFSRR
jgi:hypothetical protein